MAITTPIFEDSSVLEMIQNSSDKKKIISLCKALIKKNSYKSSKDCENLCHLTYWLYIHGQSEWALMCIKPTHQIPYFSDAAVWTFIHAMWGLEIRLLRGVGKEDEALELAGKIDEHYLMPTALIDTTEKRVAHENKRRARFTYESVICEDKIIPHLEGGSLSSANAWRLTSLFSMIGKTETGLFANLNERRLDIEVKIQEYISELQKVK